MPAQRYHHTGRDSWHARSGYQRTSRFDVPLERTADTTPSLSRFGLALVVAAFVGMWFVS